MSIGPVPPKSVEKVPSPRESLWTSRLADIRTERELSILRAAAFRDRCKEYARREDRKRRRLARLRKDPKYIEFHRKRRKRIAFEAKREKDRRRERDRIRAALRNPEPVEPPSNWDEEDEPTPPNGRVTVGVTRKPYPEPRVTLR